MNGEAPALRPNSNRSGTEIKRRSHYALACTQMETRALRRSCHSIFFAPGEPPASNLSQAPEKTDNVPRHETILYQGGTSPNGDPCVAFRRSLCRFFVTILEERHRCLLSRPPLNSFCVAARRIEEFRHVIAGSFRPDATFLNSLLLTRFYSDRAVMIHNWTLVESQGSESMVRSLASRDQLVAAVEEHFDMPRAIVAEAVNELGDLQDPWN
jgi:hypothetical protein